MPRPKKINWEKWLFANPPIRDGMTFILPTYVGPDIACTKRGKKWVCAVIQPTEK